MNIKLDHKDKLLLSALDRDARLSFSQLSKITRISQETVRYRLNQLMEAGVIKKFINVINSAKLGFSAYQIMFKLQNVNEQKKKEIIDSLIKNPYIDWVANLEGNFDIACIILIKNQKDLQNFVERLYALLGDSLIKKSLSVIVSSQFLPRDYILNKPRREIKEPFYKLSEEIQELDEKNKMLCALLSENGRYSYVELASKMKISADSVVQRFKKLKGEEIIIGSTIGLDNSKIGQLHYKILLQLNDLSEKNTKRLLDFVRSNNRVIAIVKTLAEWDYEVDLEVEGVEQLKEFTMGITSQFSNIIRDYSTIRIVDMPKFTLYNSER